MILRASVLRHCESFARSNPDEINFVRLPCNLSGTGKFLIVSLHLITSNGTLETLNCKKVKLIEHIRNRSPFERAFHAISYEIVGIVTSAPIVALISGKPLADSGLLATVVAIIAMLWNYAFNWMFDKLHNKYQFKKNLFVRILHGTAFEVGLIFLTVPVISLLFSMGLADAFLLELGMLIYFFPYTIIFNWIYDKLRLGIVHNYDKKHGVQDVKENK